MIVYILKRPGRDVKCFLLKPSLPPQPVDYRFYLRHGLGRRLLAFQYRLVPLLEIAGGYVADLRPYQHVGPCRLVLRHLRVHDVNGLKYRFERALRLGAAQVGRYVHGYDDVRALPLGGVNGDRAYNPAVHVHPAADHDRPEHARYRAARADGSPRIAPAEYDFLPGLYVRRDGIERYPHLFER